MPTFFLHLSFVQIYLYICISSSVITAWLRLDIIMIIYFKKTILLVWLRQDANPALTSTVLLFMCTLNYTHKSCHCCLEITIRITLGLRNECSQLKALRRKEAFVRVCLWVCILVFLSLQQLI